MKAFNFFIEVDYIVLDSIYHVLLHVKYYTVT